MSCFSYLCTRSNGPVNTRNKGWDFSACEGMGDLLGGTCAVAEMWYRSCPTMMIRCPKAESTKVGGDGVQWKEEHYEIWNKRMCCGWGRSSETAYSLLQGQTELQCQEGQIHALGTRITMSQLPWLGISEVNSFAESHSAREARIQLLDTPLHSWSRAAFMLLRSLV